MTFREFTGKNVEEAIRSAMAEFSSDLGDLDIEIQGSRGILGVGGEEARILAAPKSAVAAADTVRAEPARAGRPRGRSARPVREGRPMGFFEAAEAPAPELEVRQGRATTTRSPSSPAPSRTARAAVVGAVAAGEDGEREHAIREPRADRPPREPRPDRPAREPAPFVSGKPAEARRRARDPRHGEDRARGDGLTDGPRRDRRDRPWRRHGPPQREGLRPRHAHRPARREAREPPAHRQPHRRPARGPAPPHRDRRRELPWPREEQLRDVADRAAGA